ncbi:MAG: hypothetical protein KF784_18090 [Fimbriimonadaceae bacterium]|nr:hypothetical protein [Fimbriimonadaceae bacterium]
MSGTIHRPRFRYRDSADSTSIMASACGAIATHMGFRTHGDDGEWNGMPRLFAPGK